MANQDRNLGTNNISQRGIEHTVIVVYSLPKNDMRLGGSVIRKGHAAGMELSGTATNIFQNRGHRVEVLKTPRLLVQNPDPNLAGVYLETDDTFVSSQEEVNPQTNKGSGRFVTTILTTQETVQGLDEIRGLSEQELLKAALA